MARTGAWGEREEDSQVNIGKAKKQQEYEGMRTTEMRGNKSTEQEK
jgi:hypothetical protein